MYCVNGTLHLEESSNGSWNVDDLVKESDFCAATFHFIKVASIPLGVLIILANILSYNTLTNLSRNSNFEKVNTIIRLINFLSVFNGISMLFYYYETTTGQFSLGPEAPLRLVWRALVWISWMLIYALSLLKLYLYGLRAHSYYRVISTGENVHLVPGSSGGTWRTCFLLLLLANVELMVILLMKQGGWFTRATGLYTVPFLVLQDVSTVSVCGACLGMLFYLMFLLPVRSLILPPLLSLLLITASTVLTNGCMFFGDFTCMLPTSYTFHWAALREVRPECFIPLAKTLTYIDSLVFPIVLLISHSRSRRSVADMCCPIPEQLLSM